MKNKFKLEAPYQPSGSQPEAIKHLVERRSGKATLVGVTGSGKTFTIANLIAQQNKPVLILSPNKTLAAQLYEEFSLFFPENKICYFVSYYDYFQPESYLPHQDIYIPKETKVNTEIERLRLEATASIVNRPDTIVIASVSCIYSLGNPRDYRDVAISLSVGQSIKQEDLVRELTKLQYIRNDVENMNGTFRVEGNTIEVNLAYQKDRLCIQFRDDVIISLQWVHRQGNVVVKELDNTIIFPAKHFVTPEARMDTVIKNIRKDLDAWIPKVGNVQYRERIKTRVAYDMEMLKEVGYCSGIENYSSYFDERKSGDPPFCLFDFFDEEFLLIIDESHIAVPQLRGMYAGDRARKKSLIEFGFRLPSAYDNRPLKFEEIERYFKDVVFVSATPGDYELTQSDTIIEQIVRPTGLVDPEIIIHPRNGQLAHLVSEIKKTCDKGYRTLVTVLTKRLAEELASYLEEQQIKVCYLHSDLKTPQRTELLQKLRLGILDCLVGVNLLREGLDLPEVALVAIMDADIEGYLRDKRSLIQTIGRAARNTNAYVLLYADKITKSMKAAIDETTRRRNMQIAYNKEHGIVPRTVQRKVIKSITSIQHLIAEASKKKGVKRKNDKKSKKVVHERIIRAIERRMKRAAKQSDFETAIALRDELATLKNGRNSNS